MRYTFKDTKMAREISRIISGVILFAAIFLSAFFIYKDEVVRFLNPEIAEAIPSSAVYPEKKKNPLPDSVDIAVPFSSQAPLGYWNQPWQDACEEASVMMAVAWARGFTLTPDLAAAEILNEVDFENRVFGYHNDTDVDDTLRLFTEFYRYGNVALKKEGVSAENIKRELASGNIVIVPLAGEILARENPYFTSPPHYHMVVIRGYDDKAQKFIVNEPGTKQGEAFRYSYATLIEAVHDWTGSASTILSGEKAMIVVMPPLPAYRR
ncbi:MAG: C39 family peptidase [Candidatus Sungiibacteriota bacterium]